MSRLVNGTVNRILNPILGWAGYRLTPIDRPTRTFEQFFAHVKRLGFEPRTVIDVGAASGTLCLHRAFPQAHFVLVEALSEFEKPLRELSRQYKCDIHLVGVGAEVGTAQLCLHEDPYGTYVDQGTHDAKLRGRREIEISTLSEILGAHQCVAPMLAKFDIQGYELEALKGMGSYLREVDVFIIETTLYLGSTTERPDLYSILSFMRENEYSVFDILDGLVRPFNGDLTQLDLVFVKDKGMFRQHVGRWR